MFKDFLRISMFSVRERTLNFGAMAVIFGKENLIFVAKHFVP